MWGRLGGDGIGLVEARRLDNGRSKTGQRQIKTGQITDETLVR